MGCGSAQKAPEDSDHNFGESTDMHRFWICAVAAALVAPSVAWELGNFSVSDAAVNAIYPEIEKSYIDIHQHPELSGHEERTATKLAEGLRASGFEVTEHVGHTGVVGVMKNGVGPVVMLRTELDALPVLEKDRIAVCKPRSCAQRSKCGSAGDARLWT